MQNDIEYDTIASDKNGYFIKLEEIRTKRLEIVEKVTKIRAVIDGVKFGTVRETYAKKLSRLDKMLDQCNTYLTKASELYVSTFGE